MYKKIQFCNQHFFNIQAVVSRVKFFDQILLNTPKKILAYLWKQQKNNGSAQEQIKREELSQLQQLRIPFETAIMRHEQDYGRIVQREEYLRSKQLDREVEADIRLSVNSPPPPREHSIAAANARDVMQAGGSIVI